MDFSGGSPLKNHQDFELHNLWSPVTPVKNIPTRRQFVHSPSYIQRNQPIWLDPVSGVQTAIPPWGFSFHHGVCNTPGLQYLNGSEAVAEASARRATISSFMPHSAAINIGNTALMNHWSPNLDKMRPSTPFFFKNKNYQVLPASSNQLPLNGNVLLPQGCCNNRSSNCSVQKAQHGSTVTRLPCQTSFQESTMSFTGTRSMLSLLNNMNPEIYNQGLQYKQQCSDAINLVNEHPRDENLPMKEVSASASFSNPRASSEYACFQNPDLVKDLTVLPDEMSCQFIGMKNSLVERESERTDLDDASKQKSKRKKHRPKVIIEGKTVRTPKLGTPLQKTPKAARGKENASGKRKYTRRKKDTTPCLDPNSLGEIVDAENRSELKSVRRSLNFDLEVPQKSDNFSFWMSMLMQNLENHEQDTYEDGNLASSRLKETPDSAVVQGPIVDNSSSGILFDLRSSTSETHNESLKLLQTMPYTTVNQNVGYSNNIVNFNRVFYSPSKGTKRDHCLSDEAQGSAKESLIYNDADISSKNHDAERQGPYLPDINKRMRMENGPCNPSSILAHTPSTGCKIMQASNNSQEFTFTDTMKFKAQEKLQTLERMLLLEEADVNTNNYPVLSNNLSSLSGLMDYNRNSTSVKRSLQKNDDIIQPPTPDKLSGYRNSQESKICGTLVPFETSKDVNKPVKVKGRRGMKKREANPPINPCPSESSIGGRINPGITTTTSRHLHGTNLLSEVISFNNQDTINSKASTMDFMDCIVHNLSWLSINREHEVVSSQAQNAIVPYDRNGGTMVPYESTFEQAKRRRLRAKVDLDPETNRVWNLLMGVQGEGKEGENEDLEIRWEEERRVFRGRVDSFIARMHLVQGDRRFSQWKGSVVDSVIGVFLTQNVSDHLSSSAFMALAAKFPLRTEGNYRGSNAEKANSPKENQTECITSTFGSGTGSNNAAYRAEKILESHEEELSFGQELPNSGSNTTVTVARSTNSAEIEDMGLVEEVVSSQNSVVSSLNSMGCQVLSSDHIGSNSMLHIEKEDLLSGSLNDAFGYSSFTELLQIAESSKFQELYCHGSADSQVIQADFAILGNNSNTLKEEVRSSLESCTCEIVRDDQFGVNHGESRGPAAENLAESDCLNKVLLASRTLSAIDSYMPIRIPSEEQSTFLEVEVGFNPQSFSHQNSAEIIDASSNIENSHGNTNIQVKDMMRSHQKDGHSPFEAEISQEEIIVQSQMENCTNQKTSSTSNNKVLNQTAGLIMKHEAYNFQNVSSEKPKPEEKARRRKAESEKKETFDWDSLRKEVNRNKSTQERSSGTMDSIDWEAVRCADVSEIAKTIRERGMNNMLAERIKDFLNRLVREHESIDLEWLRDVPPDKSKDYLLSIRGLGLKSAECVRLLTLHHLAFPVDTNVGRICVRLGWVPLQQLPESLQLHLLELYPVMETIQKYLWPRLCKLDQRTLYELHYQMITFGKVFCTKSKPNCNACPMRGECRHFASAFASARLTLPAPEDRSIVSSTHPIASVHGMSSIPQLENSSLLQELTVPKNGEPIIEEPATPEPECPRTLESEIEEAFFEDPDEIPMIRLNFEKFTQNLQNYMHENTELQVTDMSNALVALTPESASIPMPKLKNISRLRTEHQVYEIPDSHPLLEGLDQREPDDPCPYLLAIWTPGETAQSIESPKACCDFQYTGQLCDTSTCFACNSTRESQAHKVRGTLLIPCRTAMRGSFPLNGTYFQVNEVFADHHSSRSPVDIPRDWIWNLPRRTVCFGTSIPTIFRGLSTEGIQQCFWRGFVCVRGFDRVTRSPKPLYARLHFPASKAPKNSKQGVHH